MTLHKEFSNNEKGKYFDFTSLYPSVMKYKKYPIGHPVRIINKFKGITTEKCAGKCICDASKNCRRSPPAETHR